MKIKTLITVLILGLILIFGVGMSFDYSRHFITLYIKRGFEKTVDLIFDDKLVIIVPKGTLQAIEERSHAVDKLQGRVKSLESAFVSLSSRKFPSASDYEGRGAAVFSLFDGVGPFRKNGLFEMYGGSFRERHAGPIRVKSVELNITDNVAWIIWSPDYSPAADATHVELRFSTLPAAGKMKIGFILNTGGAHSFDVELGPSTTSAVGVLPSLVPEEISKNAIESEVFSAEKISNKNLVIRLPDEVVSNLRNGGNKQIKHWFVKIDDAAGTTLEIENLSLIKPSSGVTNLGVSIAGSVVDEDTPPGLSIELLSEDGKIQTQTLSTDGRFSFEGLDPSAPVSLRIIRNLKYHYSTLGRWFVPGYSRKNVSINTTPLYINADAHAPNSKAAKFVGPRKPNPSSAVYEPHSRQYWPGAGTIQEYDSTTFTNNHGYVDRDRFVENVDGCVRIASIGGSDMVALQVRPFEKFNIILEETLGVALGKCVEVISAAVDNGDIGNNFPRIRDYTSKFEVDYTLVSVAAGLMWQVNPKMLKDGLGFDPENSALGNFFTDKSGDFNYRAPSAVYSVFLSKPTYPEYEKGIPFSLTLSVPFDVMPKEGKDAYQKWSNIVTFINENFPGQNFIFHSGVEQAQCKSNCESSLQLENGKSTKAGAKVFVQNLVDYCNQHNYRCINPEFSPEFANRKKGLTFEFDGHYSLLGNEWLAYQLTPTLQEFFSRKQ